MIGQTISHYKILEKLGEGGMGVVYKAEDTKLDRTVALKFLPPHLSSSEGDKARFIQEAKAASAINHPNICTIYSIDEHDGQIFIAMEFVDGQTLREKRGSVSFKQAIDVGIQIADGLAAAHEKGIVHRDIKPENIMIRKDGIAQIMDFGLAKLSASGSKITRLTKEGSTVGTAGYMSPEQVQGQDTDHRSDIFSYGVLLYELLTGQLPFKGVHETALAYEIVNVDPAPMSSIKPDIDPNLDAIILECLEKDPRERTQSIAQTGLDLKRYRRESSRQKMSRITAARPAYQSTAARSFQGLPPEESKVSKGSRLLLPWIIASACVIGLLALAWIHFRETRQANFAITANIVAPEGCKYFNDYDGGHIALSSDGSLLAFVAADSSGNPSLWVQSIRTGITQRLGGTDGATYPFWSPDNRSIGFFTDGSLKTILAIGGPSTIVCPAVSGRGGTWNSDGVILFSPMFDQTGIYRVSAAGGEAIPATRVDSTRNETDHRWPLFLPDGKHFLYVTQAATRSGGDFRGAVYVSDLDSSVDKLLVKVSSNVYYLNGRLLYVRQGVIVAQAFDLGTLTLSGEAIPISGNIEYSFDKSRGVFTCSQNGILIYQPGRTTNIQRKLSWFDRTGKQQPLSETIMTTYAARISPDRTKILYDTYDDQAKTNDIWVHDISRGLSTRMTFEKSEDIFPLWSPDGKQIVFTSDRNRHWDLFTKNSNGTESEVPLLELKADLVATDWSQDGKYLIFQKYNGTSSNDLWFLPMMGDRKPVPFLEGTYEEAAAAFSPDGRWVAYESGESGGRTELFVRPFPSGSGKWQISRNGGRFVRWRHDGLQLYYRSGDGTIFAVDVNGAGSTFSVGKSSPLFNIPRSADPQLYDVTPDGQRFLVGVIPGSGASPMLKLVTNWDAELARK